MLSAVRSLSLMMSVAVLNDYSAGVFTVNTPLNNLPGGTVNVYTGILSLAAGGSGDAPFTIDTGAKLDFPSNTYTMTPNGVVSGAPAMRTNF